MRTILSEANISLMKLREHYARSIEKRLEVKERVPYRLSISLKEEKADCKLGPIKWEELRIEDETLHRRKPQEVLIRLYQEGYSGGGEPFYWLDARAYMEKEPLKYHVERARDIIHLLHLCGCKKIQVGLNKIHLVQREEDNKILLQIQREITWNDFLLGREIRYFDPRLIKIVVPGDVLLEGLKK